MELNFEKLHLFVEGMKNTKEQNAEEANSYEYAVNGRLYSENGKLSYSSIKGTVPIYNNPKIVKYLGFYAFADELVLFVKYNEIASNSTSETVQSEVILGTEVVINIPFVETQFDFTNELSVNATEEITSTTVVTPLVLEAPLQDNYELVDQISTLNLEEYYTLSGKNIAGYEICTLSGANDVPEYNKDYADAIIVLKNKGYHEFSDRIAWLGNMNWDINRKITTVGIEENAYYKRVYFTENLNPLRVVNLKDNSLSYRTAEEFNVRQQVALLQPKIKEIKTGGSLPAMSVQYAYRLITDNGQVTSFSPYSEMILILRDDNGYDFAGGDIKEQTSKSVIIDCPIISLSYKEIQCIAIEYEADTIPTAIRDLGKKSVSQVVTFMHIGNEAEYIDNLSISEITETKHIWTYCNDITHKNNKLIAAGLRNEPYAIQEKYVEDLFLFKGWDIAGQTHNSLINPTPSTYRYFDPTNEAELIYLKKQLYKRFLFFGNVTLTLKNKTNPNADLSISFKSSSDQYIDYITEIITWMESLDLYQFPNLSIRESDGSILFYPTDELVITDLANYYFETSISQAIIDFENEYGLLSPAMSTNKLIYGVQSVGFNKGTGIRISFEEKKAPILNKATELYNYGPILDLETPSLLKTFVKNEIYRLSIQFFKNGSPLFAIVCGDVQTPGIGEPKRYLDASGEVAIESDVYVNQSIEGNQLMAHRLEAKIEVRIPCAFKDYVDSYQIQYVERIETNRTILAQGISAPLIRLAKFYRPSKSGEAFAPEPYNKWTLPFAGGPLYSLNGLWTYDNEGENWDDMDFYGHQWRDTYADATARVRRREIVNRRMFYFDSPDIINGKVSDINLTNATCKVLGRINTDHTGHLLRSRFPDDEIHTSYYTHGKFYENENYKALSFSRKIGYSNIAGSTNMKPYAVNISIFSQFTPLNISSQIEKSSKQLNKGEIIPAIVLGTTFEATNMALSLFANNAYNSSLWLSGHFNDRKEEFGSQTGESSQKSEGYPSIFLRTKDDLFTDELIGPQSSNPIYTKGHTKMSQDNHSALDGTQQSLGVPCTDSHAIINIKMNNEESIYGGKTKYAFSQNVFIPLSKVIPIKGSKGDTQSQQFNIEGDFYVSLYLRTKNDFSNIFEENETGKMHQDDSYGGNNNNGSITDYNRGSAWAYGVVLETEVESRLSADERFYRASGSIDFTVSVNEFINSAYFKKNNLRVYSPVPYNFKDDPLMINTLSASETKLSGDTIDAWTTFMLNEFYDLEKSKGIITNVTTWKDEIYAIQERETSQVNIDTTDFVTTQNGENVAIKKGDGRTFTNHKKLSEFGTSIRRALAEGEFGFSFMDEHNNAFVKFGEPLSLPLEIQLKLRELFEYDKIIDTEGYYDIKYKETNIRIRTESGLAYMLSYNELLQKFNGWIVYNNDIYITYDKRVFAPTCHAVSISVSCSHITSALNLNYQLGGYFEYQITATNNATLYNALDLPVGLTVNKLTGVISGTIAVVGIYNINIYADNEVCGDTVTLVVTAVNAKLSNEPGSGGAPNTSTDGTATVTGTLTAWFTAYIIGSTNGSTTLFAPDLGADGSMSGSSNGSSEVSIKIMILSGISNGSSNLTSSIGKQGQLFGISNGNSSTRLIVPNTFIGNALSTVPNAQTLATNLGILLSDIHSFKIIGSNIEAFVDKDYTVNFYNYSGTNWVDPITYYLDIKGRKKATLGSDGFVHCANLTFAFFPAANIINGSQTFRFTDLRYTLNLPSVTYIYAAYNINSNPNIKRVYLPVCTNIDTGNFGTCPLLTKIYIDPIMLTNNVGGLNAGLVTPQANGVTIVGVLNFTKPSEITNLSHSASTLNFTVPTSGNGIDFYEVFVYRGNIIERYKPYSEITASGASITGLLSGDVVWIEACDIYYNKSKSNEIVI